MKTFKAILTITILSLLVTSCSKNEDTPAPPPPQPSAAAVYENNTVFNILDAVKIVGSLNECGSNTTPGTIFSPITISTDEIIKDASKLTIEIDISHQYAAEVVIELIAPSGESCGLLKRVYSTGDTACSSSAGIGAKYVAGNKLSFNSLYTNELGVGEIITGNYKTTAATTGTFPAAVLMTTLNTFFTDKSIKGIWKLKAYDCAVGDLGKINAWKIKFDVGALK